MSSFDKHANNLLQTIDKEWNQDIKQDELVLTFTIGSKRGRDIPYSLLPLLEVNPSPSKGHGFLDPKPCTYLDCSGIKFGVSSDSTFTSLVVLNRYLEKVKFVKVLIFVPHNKLMSTVESETDKSNWSSKIFSCPALHLLNEWPHLKLSFGLVVVQQVESKQSGKSMDEMRNAFIDQIKVIRNNLITQDPSPELNFHLKFLNLIIGKVINFMILQQEKRFHWDGTVKSLVHSKTPPAYKIIRFHQMYLRVTNQISGKSFLSALKKVHDGQHFTAISGRLHNHLINIINQLIASTLSSVLKQYVIEINCHPKRKNHAVELARRLDRATQFCKNDISSNSLEVFWELISILDYPLDFQLDKKILAHFMQLTTVMEVSSILDIELEKTEIGLKKECELFNEKLRKKVCLKLATELEKERQEICTILQCAYQAISQSLIEFYHGQFLPENLLDEKSRQKAIEMLCEDEQLLEILEPDTSSSLQVTVYENLCYNPECRYIITDLLGDVDHLKMLEDRHKSVERALQLMEHQYISCGNHAASSISGKLREHVNEVKCNMITYSEIVQEVERELQFLMNYIAASYEKEQICAGLDMESLPEKLKQIFFSLFTLEERQDKNYFLTGKESLIKEMDCISELFLQRKLSSQQKAELEKYLGQLETFLKSIQQEKLKTDILEDLFTKSMKSVLIEMLTRLKEVVTILIDMKDTLSTYNCQSSQEVFSDNVSLNQCILLSLIGEDEDLSIPTHSPSPSSAYLSLSKEIISSLRSNTKIDLLSDNVLQITGNFVVFSDFVHDEIVICNKSLKEIHVFATKRIFLDANFIDGMGRELEITLIAPTIEIIGRSAITLRGHSGRNYFSSNAKAGNEYGQDGETGLPGKAGGNGGHFYLICEEIINAGYLTVNVIGGNGGAGQNGGNGGFGAPGRDAQECDLTDEQTEKEGDQGSSGGNGGDGGIGGYPGHEGSVELVVLMDKQDGQYVRVLAEPGEYGKDGKGGNGGTGGKNGNRIKKTRGWFGKTYYNPINCDKRAPNGSPGRDGANLSNQELPPPKKSKPDSKTTVISELRKFYINQSNNESVSMTRQFMEKIDSKLEFEHVTVKSLASDLLQLELTSRNLQDPDSTIRDHEAFQKRLNRYVNLHLTETEDMKHVLKLLYAQSISKVLVLKEHQGQSSCASGAQVINLLGYFDIIKDTINRLKESSVEVNRREALKTYHDHLKAKCDDTKDFISRIILPSIAQAKQEIQEIMERCAGEVKFYGEMVENDLRSRYAAQANSNIQFWEKIKTVFSVIETGIQIANKFKLTYTYEASFAHSICVAGVKYFLGIDDDDKPENLRQPSITLPDCLNDFHMTLEDKLTRMQREWELVNKFLEDQCNHDDNIIVEKMVRIRSLMDAWQRQLARFQLLLNLKREKNLALGEEFEKLIPGMEKNKAEILNFLHEIFDVKSKNDTEMSSELTDVRKRFLCEMALANCTSTRSYRNTNVPSSSEPITIAQNQLQRIQEMYAAIFKDILPLINAVHETVTPLQAQDNHLSEKGNYSAPPRVIEKWRVQTTLKKLKANLANFFRGLDTKDSLIQAVQQMEEGLSVLIDLYDMLDNYEESKLFSSALAGIKLNSTDEDSVELQETVNKIGYLLKANTFILDYNEAVRAFKQWIFPFAKRCPIPSLDFEVDLTSDFANCESHLDKLAAEYKEHFNTIHGYLLRYRSVKLDFDEVIFGGTFSSKSSACPPFFVWKFEEWGTVISRFLKGEEIELRADLMKAEELITRKMGAVKFKTVQLKINRNRSTTLVTRKQEEELKKIMKLFKVTMVHNGISYYKVFDQCFVMRGSRNEYCYSFDGATKNSTYEKSENQGDYLLSPFTIWNFRLNEILDGGGGFERLAKFEGQLDLELWGEGLYLDEGKAKEKKMDEKYLKDLHLHYELL